MAKKPTLGTRFKSLEHELARRGGVENPRAVAATIGRAKHSETIMAEIAGKGRKK